MASIIASVRLINLLYICKVSPLYSLTTLQPILVVKHRSRQKRVEKARLEQVDDGAIDVREPNSNHNTVYWDRCESTLSKIECLSQPELKSSLQMMFLTSTLVPVEHAARYLC